MRQVQFLRFSLLLLAATLAACRQSESVNIRWPVEVPASVLIRNTAILDVEEQIVRRAKDVLLEDGRIAAIEPAGQLAVEEGTQVISGAGKTLVPGLIDMHGHVAANIGPAWDPGLPDPEWNLRAYLYSGVTTVFDPGDPSGTPFERREKVARRVILGPQIYTTGPLLTCPNGHPIALVRELAPWWIAWYIAPRAGTPIDNESTLNKVVDRLAANGADAVKIVIDRIPLTAPRVSREMARAIVKRALTHGLRTVAHIGTTRDAIDAAEAGVAAWMHGIYKERIPDNQIEILAQYGIPMVATLEVFDRYARSGEEPRIASSLERETVSADLLDSFYPVPKNFDIGSLRSWLDLVRNTRGARIENVRRLHEAGVTILAGSDAQSGVFPGSSLHRELHHFVRAGFTPIEAIRAATLDAARFLTMGAEPDFGAIAVGKRADLLLVEGDPSTDLGALSNIKEVFIDAVPVERTSINVTLRPP